MHGRAHNLLNQSVAAGYRSGGKSPLGADYDEGPSDKVSRGPRRGYMPGMVDFVSPCRFFSPLGLEQAGQTLSPALSNDGGDPVAVS